MGQDQPTPSHQLSLDEVLALMLDGLDQAHIGVSAQEAQNTRTRMQSHLQDELRRNATAAETLVNLVETRTLRPETVATLIGAISVRWDLQVVSAFVASLLTNPDDQIAQSAANSAFNLASQSVAIQQAIIDATEGLTTTSNPGVASTLLRALRMVPTSPRVTNILRETLATGSGPAKVAALDVLGERTLRDVSTSDSGDLSLISAT